MFTPNLVGNLYRSTGFDSYGRSSFSDFVLCPFASVTLKKTSQKTSVRADSSASRGAADEIVSNARILVPGYIVIEVGDEFEFQTTRYRIVSKHVRRSVFGRVDHIECDLEILP